MANILYINQYNIQNFNNNNYNQRNYKNNTGCYICGRINHFVRDCYQNGNKRSVTNNNNNRNFDDRNTHPYMSNTNTQLLHFSYYNKVGREIFNCLTKQRNEGNNNNMSRNSRVQNTSGVRFVHEIRDRSPQGDVYTSQQY